MQHSLIPRPHPKNRKRIRANPFPIFWAGPGDEATCHKCLVTDNHYIQDEGRGHINSGENTGHQHLHVPR